MISYPFTNDELNRKKTAEDYVKFLTSLDINHTIALDASWGSGKTILLKFMCEELEEKKYPFITYNAWDNDYTDDPFLSLMSTIFEQFEEKKYIGVDKLKGMKNKTIAASKIVGKGLAKGVGKALLGSEGVSELSDGFEALVKGAISETSEALINKTFKSFQESKKSRGTFTKELAITVNSILKEKEKKKLFIIIDELDRCKPTFAIELLENIKHLFNVEEVVFVIAIDKVQLSESIKAVYGQGFDSITYLQRFFDFELHLPKKNVISYFETQIRTKFGIHHTPVIELIDDFINTQNLTIRDFERILSETYLLMIINDKKIGNNVRFPIVTIFLLLLKYKLPNMYQVLDENKLKPHSEIMDCIATKYSSRFYLSCTSKIKRQFYDSLGPNDEISHHLRLPSHTLESFALIKATL